MGLINLVDFMVYFRKTQSIFIKNLENDLWLVNFKMSKGQNFWKPQEYLPRWP